MTRAADILRERAAVAAGQGRTRDMEIIGAVADLMEAGARYFAWCRGTYTQQDGEDIFDDLEAKLAALERAIEGESDAAPR